MASNRATRAATGCRCCRRRREGGWVGSRVRVSVCTTPRSPARDPQPSMEIGQIRRSLGCLWSAPTAAAAARRCCVVRAAETSTTVLRALAPPPLPRDDAGETLSWSTRGDVLRAPTAYGNSTLAVVSPGRPAVSERSGPRGRGARHADGTRTTVACAGTTNARIGPPTAMRASPLAPPPPQPPTPTLTLIASPSLPSPPTSP